MSNTNFPNVLSIEQAAEYLGVSESLIKKKLKKGDLQFPVRRLGRRYLIPKKGLDEWLCAGYEDRENGEENEPNA
ncbi:MAG: helix-turn-helix domain-containing protein [Kiritimatiellae bacterium]|nr:helix-turn-helix domain-containing protein [Kiritimatiellia bacterium]